MPELASGKRKPTTVPTASSTVHSVWWATTSRNGGYGGRCACTLRSRRSRNSTVDAHRDDGLVGRRELVERGAERGERQRLARVSRATGREPARDDERRLRLGRHRVDAPVGVRDPRLAVDDHELAVEVLDRADAEVGARQQVADADVAVVVTVHQRRDRAGLDHQVLLRDVVQRGRNG